MVPVNELEQDLTALAWIASRAHSDVLRGAVQGGHVYVEIDLPAWVKLRDTMISAPGDKRGSLIPDMRTHLERVAQGFSALTFMCRATGEWIRGQECGVDTIPSKVYQQQATPRFLAGRSAPRRDEVRHLEHESECRARNGFDLCNCIELRSPHRKGSL